MGSFVGSETSRYSWPRFCTVLRIGILPLEIELGSYVRTNVSERICKLCKQDIKDENHFVCVCPELD